MTLSSAKTRTFLSACTSGSPTILEISLMACYANIVINVSKEQLKQPVSTLLSTKWPVLASSIHWFKVESISFQGTTTICPCVVISRITCIFQTKVFVLDVSVPFLSEISKSFIIISFLGNSTDIFYLVFPLQIDGRYLSKVLIDQLSQNIFLDQTCALQMDCFPVNLGMVQNRRGRGVVVHTHRPRLVQKENFIWISSVFFGGL